MGPSDSGRQGDFPQCRGGRGEELIVFGIIAAVIWPVLAVGIVGGYGFLVWMTQLVLGPPGPPHP